MNTRNIGDRAVGEIGLGCMGMSHAYGQSDDPSSLAVLARSLELGVDHWDTADLYGAGENERLLAQALPGVRDRVFLATKFGNVYDRTLTSHQDQVAANAGWIVDGTPEYARKSIDLSLRRLGVDHVDLYYLHRTDDTVPIEETVGAMAEFVKAGKVRAIGLSECSAETLRRAQAVHPITAVQSELSVWTRDYLHDVVPLCAEIGAAFVAYSPLGRGFLTGRFESPDDIPEGDFRRNAPRFQGENFAKNKAIVDAVREIADAHGAQPGQVALAWVLAQGSHVVTIPGTKRVPYLEENAAADELTLTGEELARLSGLPTAAGGRYAESTAHTVNR
ncbi:aldo/keto reductase [bacterium]|nr:MAG: aldo/keto reductase [bacterium]